MFLILMEEENQFYQLYPTVFLGLTHGKREESYFLTGDQFVLAHGMSHKIAGRVYVTVSKPTKFADKRSQSYNRRYTQSPTTNSLSTLPWS